jgi:hypothetical protein
VPTLNRFACTILIVAIVVSGLSFVNVDVRGTVVGGNITSDMHWTIVDSPFTLNSDVKVYNNSTLTIDPGVTVNFGSFRYLTISGMLIAVGDPNNKITFTVLDSQPGNSHIVFDSSSIGWNDLANSGSILQYVSFNRVALQIRSSLKVDNCYFSFSASQSPITISGGSSVVSPTISNNKIVFTGQDSSHDSTGISVNSGATPVVNNNEFDSDGQLTGINLQIYTPSGVSSPSFTISNNVFSNCWLGIKAETAASVTVQGNSFLGCHDGLDINVAASLIIQNNLIDGCTRYGINGGGYIDSNTISNNKIGIHNPEAGTIITNNNIVGNAENSITATKVGVSAQNNWWGIADAATIQTSIYDVHADPSLGTITFVPFLNSPSPSAPTIPATTPHITPAPSTTPTTNAVHVTESPTPPPTIPPTATPTKKSETILNTTVDLLNLNLITSTVIAVLALVWVVVILGYVSKRSISRYKEKVKNNEKIDS